MSNFNFNEDQADAMERINKWIMGTSLRSPEDYEEDWMFCVAGYAGTGKTFLMAELIKTLGGIKYHCLAPTGKAASILMDKLDDIQVNTIHSALYLPVDDNVERLTALMNKLQAHPDDKDLKEEVRKELDRLNSKGPGFCGRDNAKILAGDLVIVDEASMVDSKLRDDLRATGCRAIFVGDSGQLPPVGDGGWFLKVKPNARLEQIHRQALDNPIIRFSMEIRDGVAKPRDWMRKEGCGIWKAADVAPEVWMSADQIITGRNASRHKINRFMRKRLGHEGQQPQKGEKLICLKNDNRRIPQFINGTIFKSNSAGDLLEDPGHTEKAVMDICYNGIDLDGIIYYPHHCIANYKKDAQEVPRNFRKGLMELDYAYAITCHKSQGSEWDSVIIADDKMQIRDPVFRRRWLYTAVTRAKKNLMVIQTEA